MKTSIIESSSKTHHHMHYGFSLLRTLMCFTVVLSHFWIASSLDQFIDLFFDIRPVAVPVFMLISFYLASDSIINVRAEWAKKDCFG